jgi:hypothetical protein
LGDTVQADPFPDAQACPPSVFPLDTPSGPYTSAPWQQPVQMPAMLGIYIQSDWSVGPNFDPRNANKPLQLGRSEYLRIGSALGITWKDEHPNWETAGLAPMGSMGKDWRDALLQAMQNTNTINFIVDGMNVLDPAQRADLEKNPDSSNAHWEMDQIVKLKLLEKLHLWESGQEITGERRLNWIDEWKALRGLP